MSRRMQAFRDAQAAEAICTNCTNCTGTNAENHPNREGLENAVYGQVAQKQQIGADADVPLQLVQLAQLGPNHEPKPAADGGAWDDETAALIRWFKVTPAPSGRVVLYGGAVTILDAARYWAGLNSQIAVGSNRGRGKTGGLQMDLLEFRKLLGNSDIDANRTPRRRARTPRTGDCRQHQNTKLMSKETWITNSNLQAGSRSRLGFHWHQPISKGRPATDHHQSITQFGVKWPFSRWLWRLCALFATRSQPDGPPVSVA